MDRSKYDKSSKRSNILYWTVGSLLIITMLSVWLLSGLMAKYTVAGDVTDSARVAKGIQIEMLEHEAVPINGIYYLKNEENKANPDLKEITEVKEKDKNNYDLVIPGVDIAKDPFVRLNGTSEVDYNLYVEITESKDFPETITYYVRDDWEPVEGKPGVYKYKNIIDSGTYDNEDIYILLNDELIVSEHYSESEFSLTFKAWVKQVD